MTRSNAVRTTPMGEMTTDEKKTAAAAWFRELRDAICAEFEKIEVEYSSSKPAMRSAEAARAVTPPHHVVGEARGGGSGGGTPPTPQASHQFTRTPWQREQGGGGEISIMKGRVFEKVGVNISTVEGEFSEQFRKEIPGAAEDPRFWASGISLVAHMCSPLVPAAHFNTRMIVVGGSVRSPKGEPERSERGGAAAGAERPPSAAHQRLWFGGGGDLNPMFPVEDDTRYFHAEFQKACDAANKNFYPAFKGWCDEYFYIPHRNESRGVGGIFYDYLGLNRLGSTTTPITSGQFGKGGVTKELTQKGMELAANANLDWHGGFDFTQAVGRAFLTAYPTLIRKHMFESWTPEQREHQLLKRGRYAEYNLLYDRGTRFGLMTGGNPEAILMSLPPEAKWA